MSAVKVRQFELYDANSESRLICWLENDKRLRVGRRVTLVGIATDWIIMKAYKTIRTADELAFERGWKVGGLL